MRHYTQRVDAVMVWKLADRFGIHPRTVKRWVRKYLKAGVFTVGPERNAAVSGKTARRFTFSYKDKRRRTKP